MQVIENHRHARMLRDVDRLRHGVDVRELLRIDVGRGALGRARQLPLRILSLAPQMGLIMSAVRRDDLCELDDLLRRAPASRHVLEAG